MNTKDDINGRFLSDKDIGVIREDKEVRPSNLKSVYIEHPSRFLAFGIFVALNIVVGTFASCFVPVSDQMVKVD